MARRKKITVETDNSNWQAPKVRKKRKPMTEEQRVAAAARLEKAREIQKGTEYSHQNEAEFKYGIGASH